MSEEAVDTKKVAHAISYLRKRAGYTQKDLANRIGISDKAVSKWERGISLPDIAYLRKLAILLDTDSDSLLSGDVLHHANNWIGILILNENEYSIGAGTNVYDKPLVYFLLSYFLLVGIRHILVCCTESDRDFLNKSLGDGSQYGIQLQYHTGTLKDISNENLTAEGSNIMLVYGKCILYGVDQTRFFQKAMQHRDGLTILTLPKNSQEQMDTIRINTDRQLSTSDSDALLRTQYDYSAVPFIFLPSELLRQTTEIDNISRFIEIHSQHNDIHVEMLDRGFVAINVDNWDDVMEAATFMKIVQDKCGMTIYCLEEVAWRRGMISLEQLKKLGEKYPDTKYRNYILSLYERNKQLEK